MGYKVIYTILFVVCFSFLKAQTGIGTTTPNASAKLDVYSTNKGFLPPRVTLTSATDASTIASPAEGLLVYNVGSVGLQAGYYYWNGANWATIATATSAGNGVTSMNMVKLYGEAHSKTSGKIGNSTTGYEFTVPVSGRYLFDFTSSATTLNGGTNTIYFTVRQGTTVLSSDNQSSYNNNVHVEYNGKVEVNLQAGVNYNVYNYATSGSFEGNDYDRVYYKLVSGNLPVTGQSVDYGIVRYTGADGSSLSANATVPFDATAQGNLSWSSANNRFTLKANKTYEIESYLAVYHNTVGVAGIFQIYNFTNSTSLANGLYLSMNGSGGYNVNANGPMRCVITPTTDIEVGVRITTAYGGWPSIVGSTSVIGANGASNQSYLLVKQIGSSAIVNPWVLSGNDVYNTTGEVGIGNTAPNAKLDVRTNTSSTTDPGAGTIGLGTTSTTAAAAGIGALRFNNSTNKVEVSTGSTWQGASSPIFAQFQANTYQNNIATNTKLNFQTTIINVGGITIASNNTITLPAGRIYRIDFNAGWVSMGGGWARFAIYNNGTIASIPAHLEAVNGNSAINSSGATTTFINTSSGSTTIDVRYLAPSGSTVSVGDSGNGTSYPYIVIQAVD